MFRTQFERIRVNTDPGDRLRLIRGGTLNKKKQIVVEVKGSEDLYSYINTFADSVDIHVLMARFTNGDKQALAQRAGAFMDISNIPTNLNEFVELYRNGQAYFNSLPVEIKSKFNNNADEFVAAIGTDEFNEVMNLSPNDIKKEKVKLSEDVKKVHIEGAKAQFNNSVYGDVGEITDPVSPTPIIEKGAKQ